MKILCRIFALCISEMLWSSSKDLIPEGLPNTEVLAQNVSSLADIFPLADVPPNTEASPPDKCSIYQDYEIRSEESVVEKRGNQFPILDLCKFVEGKYPQFKDDDTVIVIGAGYAIRGMVKHCRQVINGVSSDASSVRNIPIYYVSSNYPITPQMHLVVRVPDETTEHTPVVSSKENDSPSQDDDTHFKLDGKS